MTTRTDRVTLDKGFAEDESTGFLTVNAKPTRAGIFSYTNTDGTIRRELRHPDDVFKADSMSSLKNKPFTDLHPRGGRVHAQNSKSLMNGLVTGDVTKTDDDYIAAKILVTDAEMIRKIKSGQQLELSCGYDVDVIDEAGEYNGEHYDAIQKNIKYNHVASVPLGRAGGKARIYCDSADDAVTIDFEIKLDEHENEDEHMKTVMALKVAAALIGTGAKAFKADAIDFEIDKEIEPVIKPLLGRIDDLTSHATWLQKTIDSQQGTIDELSTKADSKMSPEELNKVASERADILGVAGHVGLKDFSAMSNDEIKRAVIIKKNDGLNLDDKNEDYVAARFDSVTEQIRNDAKGFQSLALLAAATQSQDPKHINLDNEDEDEKSPRDIYVAGVSNMHKDTLGES